MSDEPDRQELEDRIDELEQTIAKMLPSRRDALKLGGAALVGGAAMSGAASAQPGDQDGEAGVIGTENSPVDIEASDIEVDDLVVNQSATLPFPGGVVLESGDSITVASIFRNTTDQSFVTLYNGTAKDVLGGIITAGNRNDFLYTFSDNTTLHQNGTGTTYTLDNESTAQDQDGTSYEVSILPPARDVIKIEVGTNIFNNVAMGAKVLLKD